MDIIRAVDIIIALDDETELEIFNIPYLRLKQRIRHIELIIKKPTVNS